MRVGAVIGFLYNPVAHFETTLKRGRNDVTKSVRHFDDKVASVVTLWLVE
jgi:hypothetical protein